MSTTITFKPRRDIFEDSFTDMTSSAIDSMSWENGELTIVFVDDLTDGQIIDIKFRIGSKDDEEGVRYANGRIAMDANQTYTETGFADEANTIPQVMALTTQVNDIWHLLMGPLADLAIPTPPAP